MTDSNTDRRGSPITRHRIEAATWATCKCGWTSSPQSQNPLEHQIEAHLKWCQAKGTKR